MLRTASLVIVLGADVVHGQNLVLNHSFEDYTINCQPFGADYDWIEDWTSPGCSNNPWILHACNQTNGPWASVPSNQHGYQPAQDGDAYMAVVPFITNSQGGWDGNPSTYASVEFASPLVGGVEYCVQLWASLADSSSYSTSLLSAFIWYGIPSTCGGQDSAWDTFAQVSFDITPVDTLNWHLLEGSFVAAGGETSLTLGSFQSESEVDTVFLFDHVVSDAAIYFVDNVYLGSCDVGLSEVTADQLTFIQSEALITVSGIPESWGTVYARLLSASGQQLYTVTGDGPISLSISGLADGLYYIEVTSINSAKRFAQCTSLVF